MSKAAQTPEGFTGCLPLFEADLDGHCVNGFNWLCNLGQRISNEVTGYGWHTNSQVDDIVNQTRQRFKDAGAANVLENLTYKQTYQLGTANVHDGENIINVGGLVLSVTVGPAMPALDGTGKVHGDIPNSVPENWTKDQLEQMETDLEKSIEARKQEQARLGEDGPHRARIQQEEKLLRQVQKKLSGT